MLVFGPFWPAFVAVLVLELDFTGAEHSTLCSLALQGRWVPVMGRKLVYSVCLLKSRWNDMTVSKCSTCGHISAIALNIAVKGY